MFVFKGVNFYVYRTADIIAIPKQMGSERNPCRRCGSKRFREQAAEVPSGEFDRQREQVSQRKRALLVAKRFDGVEIGRAVGGIETEANADGRANDHAGDGPANRENRIDL